MSQRVNLLTITLDKYKIQFFFYPDKKRNIFCRIFLVLLICAPNNREYNIMI